MKIKIGNIRITINRYSETKESDIIREKTLNMMNDLNATIDGKLFTSANLTYTSLNPEKSGHKVGILVIHKFLKNNNNV